MGLNEIRSGESVERHVPVLQDAILRIFQPHAGAHFIDATLGDGGHAEALLLASAPDGRLLGLDRDSSMLSRAKSRLQQFGDRFVGVHTNFVNIGDIAKREGFDDADGILFDLGVASWHFDASGRGFSFQRDEPLDARDGDPGQAGCKNSAATRVRGRRTAARAFLRHMAHWQGTTSQRCDTADI